MRAFRFRPDERRAAGMARYLSSGTAVKRRNSRSTMWLGTELRSAPATAPSLSAGNRGTRGAKVFESWRVPFGI